MKEKTKGKKKKTAVLLTGTLILGVVTFFLLWRSGIFSEKSENLALQRGVKATCDSVETESLSADKVIDGEDSDLSSRWSSENNWEDASHYIELEFPEEISVSFVVLKWERTNVISYRLESSLDGQSYTTLEVFEKAPAAKRQEIALAQPTVLKYLRLSTDAVSKREEDYSNLYQNVSLFEFEVYEKLPVSYQIETPEIVTREDGSRYLQTPQVPQGYQITYLGADYEQIIGAEGEIYPTLQEKEVVVGYRLEQTSHGKEEKEVSFTITVPAAGEIHHEKEAPNPVPEVIPALAEWSGGTGSFVPDKDSRIVIAKETLQQSAERFRDWYAQIMGYELPIVLEAQTKVQAGDFYLVQVTEEEAAKIKQQPENTSDAFLQGLGREGYVCDISDKCVIKGSDVQGIYWGTISILQILKGQAGVLPQGIIRDYPKYEVRGFGIDVARKPVSMEMLYQIMETMSWYKMNDFGIHLNDNAILSTSGLTDSVEEAMTAYSAFRLDSSVINEAGEKLTAKDYAYTAKEFSAFIETAKTYGVAVVPELDTPAHSLSITRLFPEYALTVRNEAVDQIDLSNQKAVALVKEIWKEALTGSEDTDKEAAFAQAETVNIGMDEYYGDGETYRKYMQEIIALVKEQDETKTIRLWGSLSNMEGTTMPLAEGIQMNVWSDIWADPAAMYEAGYTIINMQNNHLYIIPGGGYDYLDSAELYQNWEVNKFYDYNKIESIPAYSAQMAGAAYMIWNDMCDTLDIGISEYDLFDRFYQPLAVISSKLWGECGGTKTTDEENEISYEQWSKKAQDMGTAPDSNPYAEAKWTGELSLLPDGEVLSLHGGSDFAETGYDKINDGCVSIGGSYQITMQVYRQASAQSSTSKMAGQEETEQILLEADSAYGQTAFKAVQKETGQVGFSREGRDYSFDYILPEGEWVTLTIAGRQNQTSLYVNGTLTDTLGDDEPFSEYATFVCPLQRIGSKTNSFCGEIRELTVTVE